MKTLSTTFLCAASALAAAFLGACGGAGGGSAAYGTGDPRLAAAAPGSRVIDPFLADGDAVLRALDAIEAKSGKPLRVTSMNADQINGLTVHVQEPRNHVNVDEYVIAPDGTMNGPKPVQLMSLGGGPVTAADVDGQTFDPRAIGFRRLSKTVAEAIAASKFDDARAFDWEITGVNPDDRRYIYFQAARGRPVAVVRPDMRLIRVQF